MPDMLPVQVGRKKLLIPIFYPFVPLQGIRRLQTEQELLLGTENP